MALSSSARPSLRSRCSSAPVIARGSTEDRYRPTIACRTSWMIPMALTSPARTLSAAASAACPAAARTRFTACATRRDECTSMGSLPVSNP